LFARRFRLRISALYALAQNKHGLVIGTDNADERYVGYFTKYGDGGVDLLPIAHLVKREVVEAAKILGVPDFLADRVPSAGLFEGQTDETEMGVSYQDLDDYLIGKDINETSKKRIQHLHNISEHKRNEIPTPESFVRE
jgi:NAD+ synthase